MNENPNDAINQDIVAKMGAVHISSGATLMASVWRKTASPTGSDRVSHDLEAVVFVDEKTNKYGYRVTDLTRRVLLHKSEATILGLEAAKSEAAESLNEEVDKVRGK